MDVNRITDLKILDLWQELLRVLWKEVKGTEACLCRINARDLVVHHRHRSLPSNPHGLILKRCEDLAANCRVVCDSVLHTRRPRHMG